VVADPTPTAALTAVADPVVSLAATFLDAAARWGGTLAHMAGVAGPTGSKLSLGGHSSQSCPPSTPMLIQIAMPVGGCLHAVAIQRWIDTVG
jgi:hypothetical protein